jgi:two-component system OmpR family sensor kinase
MRLRSLRARLLLGVAVLVAGGLTAGAVVTYAEQRSFLMDRVDQQVQAAVAPLSFQLGTGARHVGDPGRNRPRAGDPPPGAPPTLPPGTFGALLGPHGTVLRARTFSYGGRAASRPSLPSRPQLSSPGSAHPFTVSSHDSGRSYRATAFRTRSGDTLVVAVPLHEVDQTLHRLIRVELIVGVGVILALIGLGWIVIRIGLRPLSRIGHTASEIAAGDLSRRVQPSDSRTEVGRLGRSLNEMLGQIETAFAAQQQSEDRLRRFLADASHELRTPLAAIRGYAELFRMGAAEDPETLARAMDRIESEAKRMGVLVEDLLLLAQLDQVPEPRRVPVDLGELIDHTADDLRVTASDREVSVTRRGDGDRTVLGDPSQLRQVLANLTRNAVVHTPPGTAIELSLWGGGGIVHASVRDHGPGLPAGANELMFERFWRSEGGRRRGPDGAGLGLAIAAAAVHAHGGTIEAQDAPDGGARFVVSLPAVRSGATEPGAAAAGGGLVEGRGQETLSLLANDS